MQRKPFNVNQLFTKLNQHETEREADLATGNGNLAHTMRLLQGVGFKDDSMILPVQLPSRCMNCERLVDAIRASVRDLKKKNSYLKNPSEKPRLRVRKT